jgi:hypothetical protein
LELKAQPNFAIIRFTRAMMREQTKIRAKTTHGAERTMNQIIADTDVIETELSDLQALQSEQAITELSCAELLMIGGGAVILLE